MAAAQVSSKAMKGILRAVPALLDMPAQMWVDYDAEADVLYLAFDRPQKATDSELRDDGVIIHRRNRRVVGVTVLDASQR